MSRLYTLLDALTSYIDRTQASAATNSYVTAGGIVFYKRAGVVQAKINGIKTTSAAGTQFGTVPEGFRPSSESYVWINGSTNYLRITAAGAISLGSATTAAIYGSGIYMT